MADISINQKDVLTVKEAAEKLGVTRLTLYRWIAKDKISTLKFGKFRAIPRSEVERILKARKKELKG
jgi:excisionase family DNA binding protein